MGYGFSEDSTLEMMFELSHEHWNAEWNFSNGLAAGELR